MCWSCAAVETALLHIQYSAHEQTAGRAYGSVNNTDIYAYAITSVKADPLSQEDK